MVGEYEIKRFLGRGAMGEVYEGRHTTLESSFAIKVLARAITQDPEAMLRFKTEAKVAARLRHANIVTVDDFDHEDGHCFIRMELMQGVVLPNKERALSLQELVDKRGALRPKEAAKYLSQILSGIGYAHDQAAKVVHRDLKPANILLTQGGDAKVADFGLVQVAGDNYVQSMVHLTMSPSGIAVGKETHTGETTRRNSMVGTLAYMSPEQKERGEATHLSDLYAVGLIALYLLTGKVQWGVGQLPSHVISGLDTAWDDFVKKATDPDPTKRFQSAKEMTEAIPVREEKPAAVEETKTKQQLKWAIAALVVVLFASIGLGAWFVLHKDDSTSVSKNEKAATEPPLLASVSTSTPVVAPPPQPIAPTQTVVKVVTPPPPVVAAIPPAQSVPNSFASVPTPAPEAAPKPTYRWTKRTTAETEEAATATSPGAKLFDSGQRLLGKWQASQPNNHFQMTVKWNDAEQQLEGYLTRHGILSAQVGFSLNEMVWKGKPTDNPNLWKSSQKWRQGTIINSTAWWNDCSLDLSSFKGNDLNDCSGISYKRVR